MIIARIVLGYYRLRRLILCRLGLHAWEQHERDVCVSCGIERPK